MRFNQTEDENGMGIVADEIACDLRVMARNARMKSGAFILLPLSELFNCFDHSFVSYLVTKYVSGQKG